MAYCEGCAELEDARRRRDELEQLKAERDKLHAALAWLAAGALRVAAERTCWLMWRSASVTVADREPHDGTPAGRAAALVRLWERVTGEGEVSRG
jgi:hypothetical protein